MEKSLLQLYSSTNADPVYHEGEVGSETCWLLLCMDKDVHWALLALAKALKHVRAPSVASQ